jgi:hypothetical protein
MRERGRRARKKGALGYSLQIWRGGRRPWGGSQLWLPSIDGFWLEHKSHFKFGLVAVAVAVGVDL